MRPTLEELRQRARNGGLKGGPARAQKLSATRRSEIARKAAEQRWRHLRRSVRPM